MPKDESYRIRCIDCKRGVNGNKDCGAGWYRIDPNSACYLGEALPNSNPKKGKIHRILPGQKFYEKGIEGTTQIHKARKEHTCDFCGCKTHPGSEYLANFIFNPDDTIRGKRFLKSCMECKASIIVCLATKGR